MKRLLPAFALVCLLSVPSMAGDTNGPGATATPTPICVENCTSPTTNATTTTTTPTNLTAEVLLGILLIALALKG